MKPEYFLIAAVVLIAIIAILVALYAWMTSPTKVLAEIDALDLDAATKASLELCCESAKAADNKVRFYDLSAPIVMLLVLPFVKREADRLPRLFSAWDNNVSLNGDGHGWQDPETGEWFDIRVKPAPEGVPLVSHNDPAYGGDCYYARGHHPRSFWARWVWVGWRNRASQMSKDLGEYVNARPTVYFAEPAELANRSRDGYYLLHHNNLYQWRQYERRGPIVVMRNLGYKLEIVRNSPSGTGRVAAVAIGISFKRRRA